MFKKLFSMNYNDKLVFEYLYYSKRGALISNILAPIFIIISLYEYIPIQLITFWFSLIITLYFIRLHSTNKLIKLTTKHNSIKTDYYFKINLATIFLTSLLYGVISWYSVLYDVPDANIFMLGTIIIALTAGSISTLGSIFIAFAGFLTLSVIPLITALVYHGGMIFDTYALLLIIYLILHISSGHKLFVSHQKSIELENKFATIYNKSSDGIVIIKNNRAMEFNEKIIKIFGFASNIEEFIKTPIANMSPTIQPDGILSSKKMLSMLNLAKNNVSTFEWLHIKKSGEYFWVEITLRAIYINNEKVIHGIWRDINDKKIAEQALEDLNKTLEQKVQHEVTKNRLQDQQLLQQSRLAQMGEMLNMIAHQWRQPLNSISITANNLSFKCIMDDINKETFKNELGLIDQYSQYLSKTIDDFRDFFKDNKEKEVVNLEEIIDSTLNIVKTSLNKNNIKLISNIGCKVTLETYPSEIKQVILNIIKNAEDILLENKIDNPTITVETLCDLDKEIHIILIKDNGGGIEEKIIDKIFDPYFSTKLEKDGTGLGLYMSRTIIEDHCNGKLHASNDHEGAVFTITL